MERERGDGGFAKEQFDNLLHTIADHSFVTQASREKRDEFRILIDKVNTAAKAKDPKALFVVFPVGSVGIGVAVPESDIDAQVYFVGRQPIIRTVLKKFGLPNDSDIVFERFGSKKEINSCIDSALLHINSGEDPILELSALAVVFLPSLNEFTDEKEKTMVDSWRKNIIQQLVTVYPEQAQQLWEAMRVYLEQKTIRYEENIDPDRRKRRVESIFATAVAERFPEDEKKQQRALSFIQHKRSQLRYPDLQKMKEVFGLNI